MEPEGQSKSTAPPMHAMRPSGYCLSMSARTHGRQLPVRAQYDSSASNSGHYQLALLRHEKYETTMQTNISA